MSKISNFFIACPANNYHPPVLSAKAFLIYGLLMLIMRLLFGILPAQGTAVDSLPLMDLINQERSARNLTTLATHPSLITAASQKSQDMINRDFFAHVDPDGNYVWGKITAAGYGAYKILGENLAVDFLTSEGMVRAWIDSPTHRANLLHTEFLEQGLVALYGDFQGRYTNLTTSLFGARLAGSLQPAPSPNPNPTPTVQAETVPLPTLIGTPPTNTESDNDRTTPVGPAPAPVKISQAPTAQPPLERQKQRTVVEKTSLLFNSSPQATNAVRIVSTILGIIFLGILAADSVIIYRHEALIARSHSSYHLFNLVLIVLVSILIWYW